MWLHTMTFLVAVIYFFVSSKKLNADRAYHSQMRQFIVLLIIMHFIIWSGEILFWIGPEDFMFNVLMVLFVSPVAVVLAIMSTLVEALVGSVLYAVQRYYQQVKSQPPGGN